MTGPEDLHSARPISVAELLAKNGTIGAPPVGGRRRRRRGNSDAVTVAELTGEIPIIADHRAASTATAPEHTRDPEPDVDESAAASTNGVVEQDEHVDEVVEDIQPVSEDTAADVKEGKEGTDVKEATEGTDVEPVSADTQATENPESAEAVGDLDDVEDQAEPEPGTAEFDDVDDDYADAVADYAAHIEHRDTDADPMDFFGLPLRRPQSSATRRRSPVGTGVDAEQMSPDPQIDDDDEDLLDSPVDMDETTVIDEIDGTAAADSQKTEKLPSYLKSTQGPLFGGQTIADDLARRGSRLGPEDLDLEDEDYDQAARPSAISRFLRGTWVVVQCILAVAFGGGLFIAFDQLWKWNNIVALVLSVLVILGLVVGVRVVRKTEDIGSTLIAVAVGALVTLGPLALLQSG